MMEHTLHYHLLAAHTLFQKLFLYRVNREYPDLLPGQPKVMDFLMSRPRSFQRESAEGCLVEPATLPPILEKMERSGLIQREKDAGNRKNSIVSLTPDGYRIGLRLRELFLEVEAAACQDIAPDEQICLLRHLQCIQKNCGRELS